VTKKDRGPQNKDKKDFVVSKEGKKCFDTTENCYVSHSRINSFYVNAGCKRVFITCALKLMHRAPNFN
jgi:hypothetical protein